VHEARNAPGGPPGSPIADSYPVRPGQTPGRTRSGTAGPGYAPGETVQTAPVSAPDTSAAYLASAPLV
jgi:hypothetical protein